MAINIFLLFFACFLVRAFSCLKAAALAKAFEYMDHDKLENS